jgi:5'-nucleotidase / UDP-sugar diphosphatase
MRRSRMLSWVLAATLAFGCGDSDEPKTTPPAGQDTGLTGAADALEDTATADPGASAPEPVDWDAVFTKTDWPDDGKRRVIVLHTNDLHAHHNGTGPLWDFTPETVNDDSTQGGFARLATLVERERRDLRPGAALLGLDAGDFSYGSAFAALAPEHGTELKLMDAMGFVGTTLGNHELDWSPKGLAEVLEKGMEGATSLTVLASNLVFDDESVADDVLAAQMGKTIHPWHVVEAENGLKVGLFGLLGTVAHKLAPRAEPVTVRELAAAAEEMVTLLREQEGVDLVVCLSHSGVGEDGTAGEDEALADAVDGLDLIVGGHTHTLLDEPIVRNGTVIVQAGSYGLHLGKLVLVEEAGGFAVESWEAIPVNDSVPGLPEIVAEISALESKLDANLFAGDEQPGYRDPVALTAFDLTRERLAESNLGDLVADAVRWSASQHAPDGTVQVAFEANGVIRETLGAGSTGKILMGDLLRVLPLGTGPDGKLGYPMLSTYLTGAELKLAAEVVVGVAPRLADSFFLQVSGMRFEHDPARPVFDMVTALYLGDEETGYSETPLDTAKDNDALYHVSVNLYLAEMLGVLKTFSGGILSIKLKDKDGNVLEDPHDALLDTDPDTPGVQELKLWRTLYEYLASFPVDEATGLPKVPARYKTSQERMKLAQ